jgi:hypothetical protein
MRIVGFISMFVGFPAGTFFFAWFSSVVNGSWSWPIAAVWAAVAATTISALFFGAAQRLSAVSAEEVLADDDRLPVIYMRSFKDDDMEGSKAVFPRLQNQVGLLPKAARTEEEVLASILHDFGPVVAIGKPGEKTPTLGAARMYVSNEEWQEKANALIRNGKMVVLRLGQTEGFWWELERTIRQVNPHQLIVLVPCIPDRAVREAVRRRAESLFPKELPKFARDAEMVRGVGTLNGYLYFDADWTGHYVDLTRRLWPLIALPRVIGLGGPSANLKYGLRQVYAAHGARWAPPPVRILETALAALLLLTVLAAFVGLVTGNQFVLRVLKGSHLYVLVAVLFVVLRWLDKRRNSNRRERNGFSA